MGQMVCGARRRHRPIERAARLWVKEGEERPAPPSAWQDEYGRERSRSDDRGTTQTQIRARTANAEIRDPCTFIVRLSQIPWWRLTIRPLVRASLVVNRAAWAFRPGDVFKWSWPRYGITRMVCRILSVRIGPVTDSKIRLDVMQDAFATDWTAYSPPSPSAWIWPLLPPGEV